MPLFIKDVSVISSRKDTLVLETESGVDICITKDSCPNYIDVESYMPNRTDLKHMIVLRWDDANITK